MLPWGSPSLHPVKTLKEEHLGMDVGPPRVLASGQKVEMLLRMRPLELTIGWMVRWGSPGEIWSAWHQTAKFKFLLCVSVYVCVCVCVVCMDGYQGSKEMRSELKEYFIFKLDFSPILLIGVHSVRNSVKTYTFPGQSTWNKMRQLWCQILFF